LAVDIPDLQGHNVLTETIAELLAQRIPGASRVHLWETDDFCATFTRGQACYEFGRRYRFHAAHRLYDEQLPAAANKRLNGARGQAAVQGHA
jgi:hypothetical protein